MDKNDLTLLHEGDAGIWQKINTEFRRKCFAWASVSRHFSLEDAEDAFQDTVVELYNQVKEGRLKKLEKGLYNYAFTIFVRRVLYNYRKWSRRRISGDTYLNTVEYDSYNPCNIDEALMRVLLKCREELTPCEKKLFDLIVIHCITPEDITLKMGYKNKKVTIKMKCILIRKLLKIIDDKGWSVDNWD